MQGYGLEYNCEYFGGPYDGLKSIVISLNEKVPPKVVFEKITEEIRTEKVELGRKLLEKWAEQHVPNEQMVAAYEVRGEPEEFNDEDDIVPYDYVGSMKFFDFKKKYW